MKKKGSMTVMFCLILTVIMALICVSIQSVQTSAVRVAAANAADAGLYSTFAQYDSELLKNFDLFFLDGSYQTGSLQLAEVLDRTLDMTKSNMENPLSTAQLSKSAITSYTLATDENGKVLKKQAVAHMKETLGTQGVSFLLQKVQDSKQVVEKQTQNHELAKGGEPLEEYDRQIAQKEAEQEQQKQQEQQDNASGDEVTGEESPTPPSEAEEPKENPIEVIREIQNMGILALVVSDPLGLSQKVVNKTSLASGRTLLQGMGQPAIEEDIDTTVNNLLFAQYILQKCGSYTNPLMSGSLDYQVEYILEGENSDEENLKKVVNRLLFMREAANFMYLYMDPPSRSEASALALTIATALLIPEAAALVEVVLLLCWAYAESLIDVRGLLNGGKVPLIKDSTSWKLGLSNLVNVLEVLSDTDNQGKEEGGLDYQEYLRLLLFLDNKEEQVMRTIDMIEGCMQQLEGREQFKMDVCLEAIEMELRLKGGYRQEWNIIRSYGYDMA